MTDWILSHTNAIRLGCFLFIFIIMALWEVALPRRKLSCSKTDRWFINLAMTVISTVMLKVALPLTALIVAELARSQGWGLLNIINLPHWLSVSLAVLLLDLAIFGQHVLFHFAPPFWRLHKVHHTDLDLDVTSGIRFHPVETLISMIIKFGVICLVGVPVLAALLFEILLNATSMFNHANVRLAIGFDRLLRWIVVTPDMHRIHHSVLRDETDSNFGFNLPWWDRLFRTYRSQPSAGHEGMNIGLQEFRQFDRLTLLKILILPFSK